MITLALGWTGLGLLVVHSFSPLGHSLLAARYAYLGNGPLQIIQTILTHPLDIIKEHVLEYNHLFYLRGLLLPAGYLPLLAPWVLVLAAPTLALNLLSATPNMYSGKFQYNAEIVPILIFASIEATVLLLWLVRGLQVRQEIPQENQVQKRTTSIFAHQPIPRFSIQLGILTLILCSMLLCVLRSTTAYNVYSVMPYANGFLWPQVTAHDQLADHFLSEIPDDASVSAQTNLVPHLSERKSIYLFPYAVGDADYILLDVPGYTYPFQDYDDYASTVKEVLQQGAYGVVDIDDGYILLQHGSPSSNIAAAIHEINISAHSTHSNN